MKIKDFFEKCAYCNHVYIYVDYEDGQGEYTRELYTDKDLENLINAHGNNEITKWSVGNNEVGTLMFFYLN